MVYRKYRHYCIFTNYYIYAIEYGMIRTRFNELLKERGHSLYWLAKEAQVAYTTLWKLKTAGSQGISFAVLDRICEALNCEPGDVLARVKAAERKHHQDKVALHKNRV